MDNWSYWYWIEKITLNDGGQQSKISDINKTLNESGRDGWELVNVIQTQPQILLAFFKRKLVI